MANSIYRTAGQLGKLLVAKETNYGTPGTDFHYMGNLLTANAMNNLNYESLPPTCSRDRGDHYKTRRQYGLSFTSKFTDQGDILPDLPYLMMGNPFTGFVKMADDEYHGYSGAVVNEMSIASPKIASAIEFDVTVVAQYLSISEMRDAWNASGVHFAPSPLSCDNGMVLTDAGNPLMTIDGVQEEIPFDTWTIDVKNNAQSVPGYVGDYALDAGAGNILGMTEITASITQPSVSNKWNIRKWLGKEPSELIFPIRAGTNKYMIKLTDMYFTADTMTEHQAEAPYSESISVNARTIDILTMS